MNKRKYILLLSLLFLMWAAYAVSPLLGDGLTDVWGDLTAPLTTLSVSIIVFILYLRSSNYKALWLLLALGTFSWFIGDMGYAILSLLFNVNADDSFGLAIVYLLPNIFFSLAAASLLLSRNKFWHRLQLLTDLLAVAFLGLTAIWILFLSNDFQSLLNINSEDFRWNLVTFAYGVNDMFIIGCLILWSITLDKSIAGRQMRHIIAGVLLFANCDLVYCAQYFQGTYDANSLLDVIYLLSFLLIGVGASAQIRSKADIIMYKAENTEKVLKRIGLRRNSILFLIPFALFLFPHVSFNWRQLVFMLAVLGLHQIISSYITSGRISAQLLEHEKQMNHLLEKQIAIRTRELLAVNKELEKVSNFDSITDFFNRRSFMIQFDRMLKETEEPAVALFFADLDRFKAINDTFGHDVGDKVLVEIARRMSEWNIYNAMIARLGGDEFVIAIRGSCSTEEIARAADTLIARCAEPILIAPYQFRITMSIGITMFPYDAEEHMALLKNADIAMYHAKAQGKNRYAFFSSLINDAARRKNEMELLLRTIDYASEFSLEYQPQYLTSGILTGFEALLHWNSPEFGRVQPDEFIPIAEESDVIVQVGEWVLDQACRQICKWNNVYSRDLRVSVNISPRQINAAHFIETVERIIDTTGINPAWLDLEIVEYVAMKNDGHITAILDQLSRLGVNISIDEFGTGYSSMSYLKRFSIDRLKIARSLTENITSSDSDYQIIKAIIMMARAMSIETLAEGIESKDQLNLLADLECDAAQGFLLGRPMNAAGIEATILGERAIVNEH